MSLRGPIWRSLAVLPAAAVVACGGGIVASSSRGGERKLPAARLVSIARGMATGLGDPHVKTASVIATSKNAAEHLTTPGAVPPDPANPRAYLIVIRGRFVCRPCSRPPAAKPLRGRVAYSIWVPGHGVTDWGLQARPPRGLRKLGRIVLLELAPTRRAAPLVVGGSSAERRLLRTILTELGPTHLHRLVIARGPGGVKLRARTHRIASTWELLVVGEAFFYRSADRQLPRVVEIDAGRGGWPTSNAARRPPHDTAAGVAAIRARMRRLARAADARAFSVTVSAPDGVAVALRWRVGNAARFMRDRLRALIVRAAAGQNRYEGLLLEVDDRRGVAWADGETGLGGTTYVRPSLAGCNPFPPPGAFPGTAPLPLGAAPSHGRRPQQAADAPARRAAASPSG